MDFTFGEPIRILGLNLDTIVRSALIGTVLASLYALIIMIRRSRTEYRRVSHAKEKIDDLLHELRAPAPAMPHGETFQGAIRGRLPKIGAAEPPEQVPSFKPDPQAQLISALEGIVKAEGRRGAVLGFFQNLAFFVLGTITSILVPRLFP